MPDLEYYKSSAAYWEGIAMDKTAQCATLKLLVEYMKDELNNKTDVLNSMENENG